jgi:hypothetical protein
MFIPSLSWENDRLCIEMTRKRRFSHLLREALRVGQLICKRPDAHVDALRHEEDLTDPRSALAGRCGHSKAPAVHRPEPTEHAEEGRFPNRVGSGDHERRAGRDGNAHALREARASRGHDVHIIEANLRNSVALRRSLVLSQQGGVRNVFCGEVSEDLVKLAEPGNEA